MNRFNALFQLYLENNATDEELEELLQLALDEANLAEIERVFSEALEHHQDEEGVSTQKRLEILSRIRSTPRPVRAPVRRTGWHRAMWMVDAAVSAAIVLGIWYFPQLNKQADPVAQDETTVIIKGKDYVRLPDGTRVTLKEGSELTYNSKLFGDTTREVTLKGEGYFDVGFDSRRPFKVWTGKLVTTVLGTEFNISVTGKDKVTITVSRGKVAVGDKNTVYSTLTPNEQLAVNTRSNQFVKSVIDAETVAQWRKEYFILDKVTIAEAAELIGKRFNVKVTIENKSLNNCVINAWFLRNESLKQVMEAVSAFRQAKYTIVNDKVTIEGGRGCS